MLFCPYNIYICVQGGGGFTPKISSEPFLVWLKDKIGQESLRTVMFADYIVICSESAEQVEVTLERWKYVLERSGMKVSRTSFRITA